MSIPITRYVRSYRQPTRLRISCLERLRDHLARSGVQGLSEEAEAALAADRHVERLEVRWRANRQSRTHAPEAQALDAELDHALKDFSDVLASLAKAFAGKARGEVPERLRRALFPLGVRAITGLRFLEQEVAVANLLRDATSEPLASDVRALELEGLVEQLTQLHRRYKQALLVEDGEAPTYEELREARRAGHARFCWLIAEILVHARRRRAVSEAAALGEALTVIERYDRVVKRMRRQRRSPRDEDELDDAPLAPPEAAEPLAAPDAASSEAA
ncbi:MAG: hypothetical protein R3F62_14755 [Planctomycetota bacterium]